jgi:protein gp37
VGATTGIEWADGTVSVIEGCSKVSPACKHCYAEINSAVRVMEARISEATRPGGRLLKMWGANGFRYETANWERELRRLNRKARIGHVKLTDDGAVFERPRIFINSLSDTFEDWKGPVYRLDDGKPAVVAQSLDDVRQRFFRVAEECVELDILLLTKRPENVLRMVPRHWTFPYMALQGWPSHIWMLTTVEDQEHADMRIPELLKIPAKVRGLSVEPLLGKVDLVWADIKPGILVNRPTIHWVIVGGESGKGARPMHPDWARSIRDQCVTAGVPYFFKQWGEHVACGNGQYARIGKKNAGRVLDGRTWNEVPK